MTRPLVLKAGAAIKGYKKYFMESSRPLILAGDFNTPSDFPLYQMLSENGTNQNLKERFVEMTSKSADLNEVSDL